MVERKTMGLREVRNLPPGHVVWDLKVPAFGAERHRLPSSDLRDVACWHGGATRTVD